MFFQMVYGPIWGEKGKKYKSLKFQDFLLSIQEKI